ncbi:MAG TPA: nitroreductase family protein [Rectinemataceae bacterium]|nr:nitroreductase family protein [Rectinemataceae bacterium]
MDIISEIEKRRAFRSMSGEALDEEVVERMLRAATLAPSCFNSQPWRIFAVMGERLPVLREALSANNKWATAAPLIVVMATKPSLDCRLDGGRDYAFCGLGLAAMNLMLQATREGLYAHPIAGFSPAKAAKAIDLPEDFVPLTLIIVGRPGSSELLSESQLEREHSGRERKALGEVAFRDSWGSPWGAQGG